MRFYWKAIGKLLFRASYEQFSRVATVSNKGSNAVTFVLMLSSMNSCVPNGAFKIDVPTMKSLRNAPTFRLRLEYRETTYTSQF